MHAWIDDRDLSLSLSLSLLLLVLVVSLMVCTAQQQRSGVRQETRAGGSKEESVS